MPHHVIFEVKVHVLPRITTALSNFDHIVFTMSAPRWADGLTAAGLYYDGVVDKSKLQDTLELHCQYGVQYYKSKSHASD